jgi:hypothetical protein
VDTSFRVTLNFHPDRIYSGQAILDSFIESGLYKSQFETNTSNGGLSAYPGGDRWKWESRIFGAAYDNAACNERPKYGALNYKHSQYGASPRFGSTYFRLKEEVLQRCTFCYPDSVFEPTAFGTALCMGDLIERAANDTKDLLDDYIEAQVHGELSIGRDVDALVLDPSFRGTDVEALASKLGCPVEWHAGLVLSVSEMERHPDFRGPEFVALGREIAQDGVLTPRIIGLAAATGRYDPQHLKKVWHYLARFGHPCT